MISSRLFAAPRAALFAAFADPTRLVRWWGPRGFTSRFEVFEPRPGGRWVLVMVGPDGAVYRMEKTFVAFEPPGRVVLRHHQDGHDFVLAMDFEEAPEGTRLVWRARFATHEQLAAVAAAFAAANEENFDRLAAEMAETHKT